LNHSTGDTPVCIHMSTSVDIIKLNLEATPERFGQLETLPLNPLVGVETNTCSTGLIDNCQVFLTDSAPFEQLEAQWDSYSTTGSYTVI
jgi:hypothetical protein